MAIDEAKGWISALVGLVLLVFGAIPILSNFNLLPFKLPVFMSSLPAQLLPFIIAVGAFWLIIDAFMEDGGIRAISLIIGVLILAVGVLTLLNRFKIIGFALPFVTPMVYSVMFVVLGIFLIIAGFAMW